MDPYLGARMHNPDPTSEFMYQMAHPMTGGIMRKPSSGTHIDPDALRARLQTLGLQGPSTTDLPLDEADPEVVTPPDHYDPPDKHPLRRLPTVHEVYPEDSISMYRRPGQTPVGRTGGTDVDPGEIPASYGKDAYRTEAFSDDGSITMNTPRSMPYLDPTVVPPSAITRGTYGGPGMQAMRNKLLDEQAAQEAARTAELAAQLGDAARLASALTKLESTEEQLRTLQATLIAERVVRSQKERDASLYEHDVRDIKEELASAVRALRRARDEGRKSEEDRRAMLRAYETAQAKINQYQLELSVREAVSRGREKGRQEAWDEAAKWMGINPPLPVEPLRQIPDTVFGRTPINGDQQLPQEYALPSAPDTQPPLQGYGQTPPLQQQQQHQEEGMYQPSAMPLPNAASQQQQYDTDFGGMHASPGWGHPPQAHSGLQHVLQGGQTGQPSQQTVPAPQQIGSYPTQFIGPQHTGIAPSQHTPQPTVQTPRPALQASHPTYAGQAGSFIYGSVPEPQPPDRRSVPQQRSSLPQQQASQRAETVDHQARRHVSQPPPARHEPHAADEYLDRVEHDQRVQEMLQGTRMKSVPTSQYPTTHGAEKPLPEPFDARTAGKATTYHPSMADTAATATGRSQRRQSLSEGMHPNMVMHSIPDGDRYPAFPGAQPHGGLTHVGQRGLSRNASFTSVDPAAYALPASTAQTMHNTPRTFATHPTSTVYSMNKTPGFAGEARSRMADALRHGHGMEPPTGHLSQIEEEDVAAQKMPMEPSRDREREFSQSAIMRNVAETSQPRRVPSMIPPKHQPRPVMPSMLSGKSASEIHPSRPRPSRGHQHSQSVIGNGPRGDDPPFSHPLFVPPGMAPMAISGGVEDVQGPRHSALGLEGIEAQSGGANAFGHGLTGGGYAGGMTEESSGRGGFGGFFDKIVKAPTITVQPPSTQSKSNGATQIPSVKAQPIPLRPVTPDGPPAQSQSGKTPQAVAKNNETSHDPRLISRQTVTTTEIFQDSAAADVAPKSVKAHDIPLPRSRAGTMSTAAPAPSHIPLPQSLAPTVTPAPALKSAQKGGKQAHEILLPHSRAPTVISSYEKPAGQRSSATRPKTPRQVPLPKSRVPTATATPAEAFNIPLPKSRSRAPTVYDGASPDLLSPQTDRTAARSPRSAVRSRPSTTAPTGNGNPFGSLPNVSVIDFALTDAMVRPLPESRATTMYGTPSIVSPPERLRSEIEENTKHNAQSAIKRKPVLGGGVGHAGPLGALSPRQVPLPVSRAPTVRPRASTYARTEGTIDEVTEEESGKENHAGRKRW